MSTSGTGTGFPEISAPVTLRLGLARGAGVDVRSRVCDVEDRDGVQRLVVARPDLSVLPERGTFPHEGEELTLLWSQPSGRLQRRVAVVPETRPYGPVWLLTPLGAPVREQRRQFFRVPLSLPAVLTRIVNGGSAGEGAARATLIELSEGGTVITCAAGLPEVDTLVELTFALDGKAVTAEAQVLRHELLPSGRLSAALRFLDPAANGDEIRRFAFAVQRTRARTPIS